MNRRTFLKGVGFSATATALSTLDMPAVWAGGKSIRWRMVTSWPKNMFILQTGAERFAGDVKLMSRGKLDIQVLAGGELVGPLEVFGAVSKGTAECGNGASY